MSALRAIRNHIIFQFEDSIVRKSDFGQSRSQFEEKTDWGFEMSSYDESAKGPRWGIVVSIGHEVKADIEVGSRVLIEALQWTEALEVDGISYWGTDDSKLMAVDEDYSA